MGSSDLSDTGDYEELPREGVQGARKRIESMNRRVQSWSGGEEHAYWLNLDDLGLTSADLASLGPELSRLDWVKNVDLRGNELESNRDLVQALSPFQRVPGLTKLHLNHNRLTSTPHLAEALAPFQSLQRLDLDNNAIESTPDLVAALARMSQLQHLELNHNRLTDNEPFSQAIGNLRELDLLYLHGNRLNAGPYFAAAIAPLTKLRALSIERNRLTSTVELATGLKHLVNLETLFAGHNGLTSTPALASGLASLKNLVSLRLQYNKLTATPELSKALATLTQLKSLHLNTNNLTATISLASALGKLTRLEVLVLTENQLEFSDSLHRNPSGLIAAIRATANGRVQLDPQFKVVILGQGRVGKTQLRRRLAGGASVEGESSTHSFEWAGLHDPAVKATPSRAVPWPPGLKPPSVGSGTRKRFLKTVDAEVHLFDFGGQEALWASHRFFLSTRRTVYVVCVPAKPLVYHDRHFGRLRTEDGRLGYWLAYVDDLWEKAVRREAWEAIDRGTTFEVEGVPPGFQSAVHLFKDHTPRPPVVVVRTHCGPKAPPMSDAMKALIASHGAVLIEDYDNVDDKSGNRLRRVRDVIRTVVQTHRGFAQDWCNKWPIDLLTSMQRLRNDVGFDESGTFNPEPNRKTLTVQEYLDSYAQIDDDDVDDASEFDRDVRRRREALGTLEVIHALGVVHWVGRVDSASRLPKSGSDGRLPPLRFVPGRSDLPDAAKGQELLGTLFSPAWVRGPVYHVLWRDDDAAVINEPLRPGALIKRLRTPSHGQLQGIAPDEAELIKGLMLASDLIVEAQVPDGDGRVETRFFVPDLLPPGEPFNECGLEALAGEVILAMSTGFVPDMFFSRLVGELYRQHWPTAATRTTAEVEWLMEARPRVRVRLAIDAERQRLWLGVIEGGVTGTAREVAGVVASIANRLLERLRADATGFTSAIGAVVAPKTGQDAATASVPVLAPVTTPALWYLGLGAVVGAAENDPRWRWWLKLEAESTAADRKQDRGSYKRLATLLVGLWYQFAIEDARRTALGAWPIRSESGRTSEARKKGGKRIEVAADVVAWLRSPTTSSVVAILRRDWAWPREEADRVLRPIELERLSSVKLWDGYKSYRKTLPNDSD